MEYIDRLRKVVVLGAAGKMGSGIVLVTLLEQARLKFENKDNDFVLYALDISESALNGLMKYLRSQVLKYAEKNIVQVRNLYTKNPRIIENYDVIDQYVEDVMEMVRPVTRIENTFDANLVFEAVIENPDLKIEMYDTINKNSAGTPWFLTNTSSIPISELDKKAKLKGNLIGFHFYNPPAIQKLVELITSPDTNKELEDFSYDFAKKIRKIIVPANDVAGFIGNGHFMRDLLFGIQEAKKLAATYSFSASVMAINKITQDYLVRPMGIFQLIDYVGLDVCQKILKVMYDRLGEKDLESEVLNDFIGKGVKGGQNPDGSQKNGFLKYEKNKIAGVIDDKTCDYMESDQVSAEVDEIIEKIPENLAPWKKVIRDRNKDQTLKSHFEQLEKLKTRGSEIAFAYLKNSKEIGQKLVKDKVANDEQAVNDVLMQGFYHAYGPINNYVK